MLQPHGDAEEIALARPRQAVPNGGVASNISSYELQLLSFVTGFCGLNRLIRYRFVTGATWSATSGELGDAALQAPQHQFHRRRKAVVQHAAGNVLVEAHSRGMGEAEHRVQNQGDALFGPSQGEDLGAHALLD